VISPVTPLYEKSAEVLLIIVSNIIGELSAIILNCPFCN
jgi:hypothetical protein